MSPAEEHARDAAVAPVGVTWPGVLKLLIAGEDLTVAQAEWCMGQIMGGEATPVQIAGFFVGLRAKGEAVDELNGLATSMLDHSRRFEVPGASVDIVGTGGDQAHTVNISTMSALVIAGTGVRVIKHGNRASSSMCGSADLLEELGVRLDLSVRRVAELATEVGITFCFAQVFHPAMKYAATARRELGVPTAFNFLGPLTNPAQPRATAVGVADERMAPLVAGVFAARGTQALVFRGEDGLDELSATAPAHVWEIRDGVVTESRLDAVTELGLHAAEIEDLRGGKAEYNARVARGLLAGDGRFSGEALSDVETASLDVSPVQARAAREAVLLNAAAALVADGSLPGTSQGSLVERLRVAMDHAAQAIDSGAAQRVLERWVEASNAPTF